VHQHASVPASGKARATTKSDRFSQRTPLPYQATIHAARFGKLRGETQRLAGIASDHWHRIREFEGCQTKRRMLARRRDKWRSKRR
jgi:hypothetical protein